MTDLHRAAESLGQPWHTYFAGCLAQGRAFYQGDFAQATTWLEGEQQQPERSAMNQP